MERKKFLKVSLATLGLGLVFPSLIQGRRSDQEITHIYSGDQSLKHQKPSEVFQYPLRPDEYWPPSEVNTINEHTSSEACDIRPNLKRS